MLLPDRGSDRTPTDTSIHIDRPRPARKAAEDADQAVSTGVEQEEAVSAWERIRRSKVMESCFAYGAGGFVLLEAMDVFSGVWGWPLLVQKLFTLVLALGLLMAAAVAWFQSEGRGERPRRFRTGPRKAILNA